MDGDWNAGGDPNKWGEHPADNVDMYADVYVGRVPATSSADVSHFVDRVLIYEGSSGGSTGLPTGYLEDMLLQVDGSGAEYVLTVSDHPTRKGLQRLYIALEGDPEANLEKVIAHRIRVEYSHNPLVTVVPHGSLPRSPGKAKRILTPEEYQDLMERCCSS